MAAGNPRHGWDDLSSSYRSRLTGAGVSQSYWESGGDLRLARGHEPPAPSYAPDRDAAEQAIFRGEDTLGDWQRPDWLPSQNFMADDTAAALSLFNKSPSHWADVTFHAAADQPWTMTVYYREGGYSQTETIPEGAQTEIMQLLSHPDELDMLYYDEWDDWHDQERDFEVEGS